MALRLRDYLRLDEVSKRWNVSQEDILDCALRDMLAVSVLVANTPIVYGSYKVGKDGQPFPVHADRISYSGLMKLTADGLFKIRQAGSAAINTFKPCKEYQYVKVVCDAEPPQFRVDDLLIDMEEYKRFAQQFNFEGPTNDNKVRFDHENNFRTVTLGHLTWHFGDTQAGVVKRLYDAATNTDNPWINGKRVLQEAGSGAFRMRDLFSSQPNWQKLIISDSRGNYRLNLSDFP